MKHATRRKAYLLFLPLSLCLIFLFLTQISLARARREQAILLPASSAAEEFGVPLPMILAVIRTESDFRPNAVSAAGAQGLMQLLPQTFHWLHEEMLCEELSDADITDITVNIRYGTYYLAYLYERFGSWHTALAAYNAGEGRVAQWLNDKDITENGVLINIPFPETAEYVKETLIAYEKYLVKYSTKGAT